MNSISPLADVRRGQLPAQLVCRERQFHLHPSYPMRTASKRRASDYCVQFPCSTNHTFILATPTHSMGDGSFWLKTSASN
jgi:hypothetical protein